MYTLECIPPLFNPTAVSESSSKTNQDTVVLSSRKRKINTEKMADIFDNPILCKNCNSRMMQTTIEKNGFLIRAVICESCNNKIIHPSDEAEYNRFIDLRNKEFRVKMRLVGNSYAVSIPKEIVSFLREMQEQEKKMNDMVRLCFEDFGKLSLNFVDESPEGLRGNSRVIRAKELKVVKNNKPVLHVRQFSDSATPKNNKSHVFKRIEGNSSKNTRIEEGK